MTIHAPLEAADNLPATVELALPALTDAAAFFGSKDAVAQAIEKIEAAVRGHKPDLTTRKGREAIKSLAYSVSRSKTYLDGEGKKLVEGIKAQAAGIDAARKTIRDTLDALRDEARKPLDEWEAAEAERQARDAAIEAELRNHGMTGQEASALILATASRIKAIALPDDFSRDREAAEAARTATMTALRVMYEAAQQREKDAAELAKLRAEAEERAAREAEERAAREAAEAEARRVEAERQAAQERAEAEARADRERAQAAEQARKDAEARAAAAIEEAERRAAEAVAQAKAEAAAAIERERQAVADREAQAERERQEAEARAKREADEKAAAEAAEKARLEHAEQRREGVLIDIETALLAMTGKATPRAIAEALMAGEIPHCQVVL